MTRVVLTLFVPLAAAMAMMFATALPAAAQDNCLSNRQLQSAIASGEVPPVAAVLEEAGIDQNTEVLSVEVCESVSGLAYYVGVLDQYGEATTLVLRASN